MSFFCHAVSAIFVAVILPLCCFVIYYRSLFFKLILMQSSITLLTTNDNVVNECRPVIVLLKRVYLTD